MIKVFKPFKNNSETFDSNFVGIINNVKTVSVTKSYVSIGEFSLTYSADVEIEIKKEYILCLCLENMNYWLIARNIKIDRKNNEVTVTGTDLKGYLGYRITLYSKEQDTGTYGYDVVTGTTEECCNHYLNNNIVNPTDSNRVIPKLLLSEKADYNIGIKNDKYMSRFEPLSDVIEKLCANAGIWWDITVDTSANCFRFKVFDIVNKSSKQSTLTPVVFSRTRKNLSEYTYEVGNTEFKNVFYATKSGGTLVSDATTVTVLRKGETASKGIDRKEMHLSVNCDDVSEISTYALHEVEDFVECESLTFAVANSDGYGTEYNIGDMITVVDVEDNLKIEAVISDVTVSKSKADSTLKITVGKARPKPISVLNTKIKSKGV